MDSSNIKCFRYELDEEIKAQQEQLKTCPMGDVSLQMGIVTGLQVAEQLADAWLTSHNEAWKIMRERQVN